MMTIRLEINGSTVRSIDVWNGGKLDGSPVTAADDPGGKRLYEFHDGNGEPHVVRHRRREGIEVLASKVLARWLETTTS